MNIEYKKIFNKNYVVLTDYNISEYKECYRSKMLKSNQPEFFLPYDTQNINGIIQFTYDISSKQSIESFYEDSKIDYQTIRHFLFSLKEALDILNNYLLEPDYLVLEPQLIYLNITTKNLYFCYCPGEKQNFYDSLNHFLCYMISKIDHEDNNSIILAYSLQQQSMNKNYTFDDLIEILNKPVFEHTSPPVQKEDIENIPSSMDLSDQIQFEHLHLKEEIPSANSFLFLYIGMFLISIGITFYLTTIKNMISPMTSGLIIIATGFLCYLIHNNHYRKESSPTSCENEVHSFQMVSLTEEEITPSEPCFPSPHVQTEENYYEDTVILGYRNTENNPKLIYTGTDFDSVNDLTRFPFTIGKMVQNVDMVIAHPMISRIHSKIYYKENHYYIEDMNSSNGTYINNELIPPHTLTEISPGDYITFSHLTYIFQ